MSKFFWIPILYAALLLTEAPSFAAGNIPLTGDEFLTRLANASFRVRNGFNSGHISAAKHNDDHIMLSYNSSVFLVINETPPPHEIKNISAVLMTQGDDKENDDHQGYSPTNEIVFEDICKQVIYALHPAIREENMHKMLKELGLGGKALDGLQRSLRFEYNKYIIKYNRNGMLIMVVSSL